MLQKLMLVAHDATVAHHMDRLCCLDNNTKLLNFAQNSQFLQQITCFSIILCAQFTFNANFMGEIIIFIEKFNKFIGALTKLNVVQNATLKEKKFQYGEPNVISLFRQRCVYSSGTVDISQSDS